jgi:hypothetical protein
VLSRRALGGVAAPLFQTSLVVAVFGFGLFFDHASRRAQEPATLAEAMQLALQRDEASDEVRDFLPWVLSTGDHSGLPFIVVDKAHARIYSFGPLGQLRGSAPVLLGAARADEPGPPATPAGRFFGTAGSLDGTEPIAWRQGTIELSLHPLPSPSAPGRGLQRLASTDLEERRISEGSLHVAGGFYREHIGPLRAVASVAYVLPETMPVETVFKPYAMQQDKRIVQSSRRRLS